MQVNKEIISIKGRLLQVWRQNVRKLFCKAKSGFYQTPQSNFIRDDEGNEKN